MLGLHCCAQAFASCREQGLLSSFNAWASHSSGLLCCGVQSLGHPGFRICSTWAQLLCSMWGLPRPGIEPVSPALQDRFLTTGPPRKPPVCLFNTIFVFPCSPFPTSLTYFRTALFSLWMTAAKGSPASHLITFQSIQPTVSELFPCI